MPTVRVCVMTVEGNGLFTILVDENLTVEAVKGSNSAAEVLIQSQNSITRRFGSSVKHALSINQSALVQNSAIVSSSIAKALLTTHTYKCIPDDVWTGFHSGEIEKTYMKLLSCNKGYTCKEFKHKDVSGAFYSMRERDEIAGDPFALSSLCTIYSEPF